MLCILRDNSYPFISRLARRRWYFLFLTVASITLTMIVYRLDNVSVSIANIVRMVREQAGPSDTIKDGGLLKRNVKDTENDIRIIVITYNRPNSLLRLLKSLNNAVYFGDNVNIDVWIDRSREKGDIHEETYKVAKNFTFLHGGFVIHNHTKHVGLYGQWLGTWPPSKDSSELAVVLEDDMTVSPHFYRWLKVVHKKYDKYETINGYSLQGISIKHGGGAGYLEAPANQTEFLYPIIGTWGFSPRKQNWVDFLDWYSIAALNSSFVPLVPGILPSTWYEMFLKEGTTDGMWSMWHIYFAWHHHEFTLYSNHRGHAGLAINWREKGLHYNWIPQKQPDPLLTEWRSAEFEHLPDHPVCLDFKSVVALVKCA